jgi:hypothetical protein
MGILSKINKVLKYKEPEQYKKFRFPEDEDKDRGEIDRVYVGAENKQEYSSQESENNSSEQKQKDQKDNNSNPDKKSNKQEGQDKKQNSDQDVDNSTGKTANDGTEQTKQTENENNKHQSSGKPKKRELKKPIEVKTIGEDKNPCELKEVSKKLQENMEKIKHEFNIPVNQDVVIREFKVMEQQDAPIVKLRFTLYDENDNPVEGTEELTLWISKGNYDRKTYDGIEWCRTYYIGLIGASDNYDDMLKTVPPGTQESISIWYLTKTGKWEKWPLTFTGLTKNVYNLKFIVEKKNTIDICYVHLLDHNEEIVLESRFPIRDEEYWGIESILNTKYSDNPSRYETGGVDIEPYMTLWQDYYGNIVYYNPYMNSEFIVDYYRKDKYGNNIMLVKRFSPHATGQESMYFAAFDDEYKLVGKYHFEENDESHFKEFEYEGERYFAYAGESFGQGYRCCKFKIYSFRDNKWQDFVSWSHDLRAVLNENGIDVYRIDIYNSGGESTYLCTYTYRQLLNGVELPY